ncbi:MAG: hypothetical protein ACO3JH_03695 [Flavobacteriaceae bacterium]
MAGKTNYSYVGIAFVLLVFGIIFIPKIVDRLSSTDVVREESRTQNIGLTTEDRHPLAYILYNDEKRKVPDFSFTNQMEKPSAIRIILVKSTFWNSSSALALRFVRS